MTTHVHRLLGGTEAEPFKARRRGVLWPGGGLQVKGAVGARVAFKDSRIGDWK